MNNDPIEIGDGARLIEGEGDSLEVIEADGTSSALILTPNKDAGKPFRVLYCIPFKLSSLTFSEYAGGGYVWFFAETFRRRFLRSAGMFLIVA